MWNQDVKMEFLPHAVNCEGNKGKPKRVHDWVSVVVLGRFSSPRDLPSPLLYWLAKWVPQMPPVTGFQGKCIRRWEENWIAYFLSVESPYSGWCLQVLTVDLFHTALDHRFKPNARSAVFSSGGGMMFHCYLFCHLNTLQCFPKQDLL